MSDFSKFSRKWVADRKVNIDITMEEVSNRIKNLKGIKAQRQDNIRREMSQQFARLNKRRWNLSPYAEGLNPHPFSARKVRCGKLKMVTNYLTLFSSRGRDTPFLESGQV